MNRNDTVLQLAILLVIIAILGVALLKHNDTSSWWSWDSKAKDASVTIDTVAVATWTQVKTATLPTPQVELVTQYFEALQGKNYKEACSLLTRDRCSPRNQAAVDLFAVEHQKYIDGFEAVYIKDANQKSWLWNDIVCVKYSYRLKADGNPKKVWEILAYYVSKVDNSYRIASRVCEKKYKDGYGETRCPLIAPVTYCRQVIGMGN
jgi:hypothetical protein